MILFKMIFVDMIFIRNFLSVILISSVVVACSDAEASKSVVKKMPVIYDSFEEMEWIFNQQNDTTYVINFWATWCKPCVEELPFFIELDNTYRGQKVKLILVSLDFKKQIKKKLIPFIEAHNLQPEVIVLADPDANTWIPKVADEWTGAIPATLIYNKNKRSFHEQSFESFEELNSILKSIF
jgi:thiol-disulfide isomerase/thioredoxin